MLVHTNLRNGAQPPRPPQLVSNTVIITPFGGSVKRLGKTLQKICY